MARETFAHLPGSSQGFRQGSRQSIWLHECVKAAAVCIAWEASLSFLRYSGPLATTDLLISSARDK